MTREIDLMEEITRSRKETHGASTSKRMNGTPVFTSRMERREYGKGVHFFDIRHAIDIPRLLKDIRENWHTYVSKMNRLIQHNPIKRLVLTGIFTIILGVSAISTNAAAIVPEYIYQVKTDEKVEIIASAHGVTPSQIYAANGISSIDSQKLLLPKVENMTVTADILNVRSQPTTESSIVGKLKRGNIVKVSFVEGGWAAIMNEGRIHYVSADFLAKNAAKNSVVKNSSTVYQVKPGDTFYKISKALNLTVSSLQELNPTVEPAMLKIGQAIHVPAAASNTSAKVKPAANSSTSKYVIKPDDTFSKISKTLGVSVSSLQKLNPAVDPAKLKIGQTISIPAAAAEVQIQAESNTNGSHAEYVIKSGDTFYSISKDFGVSVSDIGKLNPAVDPAKLKIGQTINIPAAATEVQTKAESNTNSSHAEYVIMSGDTFYSISKDFGISVSDIGKLNPTVDPAKLKIGQTLFIPAVTAAAEANLLKVEASIVDVTPQGTFQFSTANGGNYSAKASGVLLNELIEHKGETFILTLEAKRGRQMTLTAIH